MLPTARRLAQPGFLKRSLDEFTRQARIGIRMEGLHEPTRPRQLISFDNPDSIGACKIMSDARVFGGFSTANLTYQPGAAHVENQGRMDNPPGEEDFEPAHARFAGSISTDLPPNKPDVQRSGFAAWRTHDRGWTLFGKLLWDIDPYAYLALRIKSDGRKYFVNIQTESIVPTDIHQHLLPCYTPGQWETVAIPFSAFVRTNHGMVVEPQKEMLRQKLKSVGVGLIDRVPGPFELRIADVYATNTVPAKGLVREDSGFDMMMEEKEKEEEERRRDGLGMLDEVEPPRKKGEPERILI